MNILFTRCLHFVGYNKSICESGARNEQNFSAELSRFWTYSTFDRPLRSHALNRYDCDWLQCL